MPRLRNLSFCHPRLVQTGLNLTECPTVVFYQFDYSTFTLRQASRRSYRPSQTQPVEVHFLCYTNTVQEKGLALMARKLRSALMAEGEFVDDGLSAFGDEGDITRELTRCLLDGHAVPGLEETFAALRVLRPCSPEPEPEATPMLATEIPTPAAIPPSEPFPNAVSLVDTQESLRSGDQVCVLEQLAMLRAQKKAADARRKRLPLARTLAGNPGQLSLFG